ncbi:MAG TPA: outer membrane beta-barrel protein [Albitalea sp.]
MKVIAKALISAAALAAFAAQAQGPYVGGSLGQSRYKGPDIGGLPTDRSDTGGKIYGGYGITPNVGVELGYAELGKADSDAGSVRGRGLFVDLVGTVPITDSFSAIGRVGAFNGKAKTSLGNSDSSTNAKYGLGVQYDFTKQTGLRAEWERYRFEPFGTKANADLFSIGVNHKF